MITLLILKFKFSLTFKTSRKTIFVCKLGHQCNPTDFYLTYTSALMLSYPSLIIPLTDYRLNENCRHEGKNTFLYLVNNNSTFNGK